MLQTNSVLQKEQSELYTIQRKLSEMLPQVQEALNSLKVEELHLKSQTVQQSMSSQTVSSRLNVDLGRSAYSQEVVTPNEQINQQQLDLNLFANKCNEEEDSD